ncbi:MAG: hypothetical protein P8181_15335 [bacterium]
MNSAHATPSPNWPLLVLALAILAVVGCGDDDGSPVDTGPIVETPPDTIAPAAVTDLSIRAATPSSLALVWKSPGDDGQTGTAAEYDIRFSKNTISDANWEQATQIPAATVPSPKPGGQIETLVVTNLESSVEYFFALKTSDEVGNQSELSNCPNERTLDESNPPAAITDLAAVTIDETSYELTWTATGDDGISGTASEYDIRYWTQPIIDETSWSLAAQVRDAPLPKPAGESESKLITGLTLGTSYYFAVKVGDEVGNWSGLSNFAVALAQGRFITAGPPLVVKGEEAFITFEAAPTTTTTISLHAYVEQPWCGKDVVTVIDSGYYGGGEHTITYDFYWKEQNVYFPTFTFSMVLCWGGETKGSVTISFENPDPEFDRADARTNSLR